MTVSSGMIIPRRHAKSLVLIMLCLLAVMSAGCASTFLISKDCKTYFFGEVNETTYKMLCLSG
ncbi:MAG TPA: hypothetical protein VLD40_07515, partial [Dissulfurispiraceae bacterium]|nr:hypothetical protein [Dissulfurispiraceae bacterium]